MTTKRILSADEVSAAIAQSELTIYDPIDRDDPLFFDIQVLENHLRTRLQGLDLAYPNRTRAKHAKAAVCRAMGYPVPKSFRRTRPRFPGQDLDVHVQKSNNLQIWNEEISPTRRYAVIRPDIDGLVSGVRVVTGETIALFDRTGTLTQKFQARRRSGRTGSRLVAKTDTVNFSQLLQPVATIPDIHLSTLSPTTRPSPGRVLTIDAVYDRLQSLIGQELEVLGHDQERNRGAELHRLVCSVLGFSSYADVGQFPDILQQALEVKLQTSSTIDLGLVSPDSQERAEELGSDLRHCDVRYAVAYVERIDSTRLRITGVVVSTGEAFFTEFRRFEGLVTNKKLQIPLPADFFLKPK